MDGVPFTVFQGRFVSAVQAPWHGRNSFLYWHGYSYHSKPYSRFYGFQWWHNAVFVSITGNVVRPINAFDRIPATLWTDLILNCKSTITALTRIRWSAGLFIGRESSVDLFDYTHDISPPITQQSTTWQYRIQ